MVASQGEISMRWRRWSQGWSGGVRARGARGRGHRNRCHAGALGSRSWVVIGEVGHRTCIGDLLGNLGWSVVWIGGGKDGVEERPLFQNHRYRRQRAFALWICLGISQLLLLSRPSCHVDYLTAPKGFDTESLCRSCTLWRTRWLPNGESWPSRHVEAKGLRHKERALR